MIIDGSYFIGDIYLPQVGPGASTVANKVDELDAFIAEYEPEILEKGLGHSLYEEFKLQLDVTGQNLEAGVDQKWENLLNGAEYVDNGITYHWQGLVRTKGNRRISLIAYYVYYWYVKDGISKKTTLGTVKPEAKNGSSTSAIPTLTNAWRKFKKMYGGGSYGNQYFKGYVNGVYLEDYLMANDNSKEVSLYEFLSHNKSDYPNWSFAPIEDKNSWGI